MSNQQPDGNAAPAANPGAGVQGGGQAAAQKGNQAGGKPGGGQGGGGQQRPQPNAQGQQAAKGRVRPVASRATFKPRHRFMKTSFYLIVVIPFLTISTYLFFIAHDQYASTTGFTVRNNETTSASELVGGLSTLVGGGGGGANGDLLFAFIQSQEIVELTQEQLDLRRHFAGGWFNDPYYSVFEDATIEDLLEFWRRMVRVSYDPSSGLMDVQVRARDPEFAQRIAQVIVQQSEAMINRLNIQARRDSMANAEQDLQDALARLRTAREDLATFRARTQIVDPEADIQGRMGVINNLQQQLAQALVDYDLLLQTSAESDPRVRQAERRIEVIQERISAERRNFATQDATVFDTDYPRLIAQFEALMVNQRFAEETYTAALAALDAARSNAERQSIYLATYVHPTLAQRADYPERFLLSGLAALFLLLSWAAFALVYYSLRDRG